MWKWVRVREATERNGNRVTQGWDGGSRTWGQEEIRVQWLAESRSGDTRLQSVDQDIIWLSSFPFRANSWGKSPPSAGSPVTVVTAVEQETPAAQSSPTKCLGCVITSSFSGSAWHRVEGPKAMWVHPHPCGLFFSNMHPCPSLQQNAPSPSPNHTCLLPEPHH